MSEINTPIVAPTDVKSFRRLQQAFRAQAVLEEFARTVRDMRRLQDGYSHLFHSITCGRTKDLEREVDARVKVILNL